VDTNTPVSGDKANVDGSIDEAGKGNIDHETHDVFNFQQLRTRNDDRTGV
jgi:hypothetical protein